MSKEGGLGDLIVNLFVCVGVSDKHLEGDDWETYQEKEFEQMLKKVFHVEILWINFNYFLRFKIKTLKLQPNPPFLAFNFLNHFKIQPIRL